MKVKSKGKSIMFAYFLGVSLCALVFVQVAEGKVRCYVCDWHSPSAYGSANKTDTCSHYNFDPAHAGIIECEGGCEAVSRRKSKNENVFNFYKNCIPPSKLTSKTEDKCISTEDDNMYYTTTCDCTSDLCNGAGKMGRELPYFYQMFTLLAIMVTSYASMA